MTTTRDHLVTSSSFDQELDAFDPELAAAVSQELRRQQSTLFPLHDTQGE